MKPTERVSLHTLQAVSIVLLTTAGLFVMVFGLWAFIAMMRGVITGGAP